MVGALQVLSHFGFWWLTTATAYAVGLAFIAAVYVEFSVAGGRPRVIVVECIVAGVFAVVATAGVTGPAWILVTGFRRPRGQALSPIVFGGDAGWPNLNWNGVNSNLTVTSIIQTISQGGLLLTCAASKPSGLSGPFR